LAGPRAALAAHLGVAERAKHLEARLADLRRRYEETSVVGRAIRCSETCVRSIVSEIEALIVEPNPVTDAGVVR
jgi:hypothetical protein